VVGQNVVVLPQVTCPRSFAEQLRSTAVQVPAPLQLTVPLAQFAMHVSLGWMVGRLAASSGAGVATGAAREARKA
jgi:hypothetical protein